MALCRLLINNLNKQFNNVAAQNFRTCSKNILRGDHLIFNHSQATLTTLRFSHSLLSRGSKNAFINDHLLLNTSEVSLTTWRSTHSFMARITAEQLWKGATSVSAAGRKKGRGKSRKKIKDLNRGQIIGVGKINMVWPGLNAPVIQGREVLRQHQLPPDENREKKLIEIRNRIGIRRSNKVHPLERGWSGNKLPGRSLGPPDPVGDETFEGFDSRCLQFKTVTRMSGQRGRVRRQSAFVVVGNKKGLAGFALAKSVNGAVAAKAARNKAALALRYINLDKNTVIHDFYCEFGANKIFVERRPEGFGLVCQRVIKAICEMVGIKDLYVKCEGPTGNYQNLTKAFFIGLMKQKSLKQIADEKQLHIVRLQKSRDGFPVVVASPDYCRTEKEIGINELIDFNLHLHGGKVVEERKKFQPFYINFPSYIKEMKDREKCRNHPSVRVHLLAKYGKFTSYAMLRDEEKAKQKLKETVEEE